MPSDLKKKKAQDKKDARKRGGGGTKSNINKTQPTDDIVATTTDQEEEKQTLNGESSTNKNTPSTSHYTDDKEYEGSDDENEELAKKLAKELESLDLASERVAQHRSVTGVLVSHCEAQDIQLASVSITFHGKELLIDAKLELNMGRRYGLIGMNGCGKSSLLAALYNREMPIPSTADMFLLQGEMQPCDKTALQCVMEVDTERLFLEKEAERLACSNDDEAIDRLTSIYERLEDLDADLAESRAANILKNLGFTPIMQMKQVKHFSGGWRMRISLARALFVKPSILLLDEPTNHLDLNACVWLEQELSQYKSCLIVISHSQDFLNNVCNSIMHFNQNAGIKYYGGNYNQFIKTRSELEENQMKRYKWEQDQISHMKDYIARFGHGSKKLARQAQSKEKTLAKMVDAGLTEKVKGDKSLTFYFPDCGELPPPVIMIQHVSFRYAEDKPWIYKNLDFGVDLDTRVALVGPNGAGKSTILKLIAKELNATEGQIRLHPHLRIGRYHQHLHEMLDINKTALNWMMSCYPDVKEVDQMRKNLGRYGLTGSQQVCQIRALSDGQRCRIIFAWLALRTPHLLLLDEPTNHLDIETIDSLAEALNYFEGGMILVSHDFRLISQVADEIWLCENQTITKWEGDIYSYKKYLAKTVERSNNATATTTTKK